MTRLVFGEALDENDVLVVQGIEYRMQPVGMRVMRSLVVVNADPTATDADRVEAAVQLVCAAVVPEQRDKLHDHIEESVPPGLVTQMAMSIARGIGDLDPTQLPSLSGGSPPLGAPSTAGAQPATSIPSTFPSGGPSTSTSTPSESGPTPAP